MRDNKNFNKNNEDTNVSGLVIYICLVALVLAAGVVAVIGVVLCCEPGARNRGLVFDNDWCSSVGNVLSCYVGHCLSFH